LDGERKRNEEKGELKGEDCKNWGTWGKLNGENPFSIYLEWKDDMGEWYWENLDNLKNKINKIELGLPPYKWHS
jgi:hypothetical protein